MLSIVQTKYHSWCTGALSEGCKMCVKGRKLVLFITGLCGQRCWYCPVSEHKFGKDVVYANEWEIKNPDSPVEMFEEIRLTEATGAGITGGDPLVLTDRCCQYIKMLKQKYGKKFHIHLYTPLKLVTKERLQKLYDAGLDEIRFHPDFDDETLWPKLELAKEHDWAVGMEIPAVPGYEQKTKTLIDFAKGKIDFINFNELERSDTGASHYKLDEMGYKTKDDISYGIKGSKEMALKMLEYAKSKEIPAHCCTAKLKDSIQLSNRIKIRAGNVALSCDIQTSEGTLLRGIAYLPELKPDFGYREKLKNADREKILEKLTTLHDKIAAALKIEDLFVDTDKLRFILPAKLAEKNAEKIKKLGLIPAVVEEYPTKDAIEVTIDFL